MTDNERLSKNFRDLFNGDPWLDSSILGILSAVDAGKAARKPEHAQNSIWEIANHMIHWREAVLARIHGAPAITPEHNYFLPIEDTSEKAWKETLEKFGKTQEAWLGFLSGLSDEKKDETYAKNPYSVYDLILGIMQHDSYHLGQLALLTKYDL